MAYISELSKTKSSISVEIGGLDSSYSGAARTAWYYVDGDSVAGVSIPSNASSGARVNITGLSPGTSYRIGCIITFAGSDYTVTLSSIYVTTNYEIGLSIVFDADGGSGAPSGTSWSGESASGESIGYPYTFPGTEPRHYNRSVGFYAWYAWDTGRTYSPGQRTTDFYATRDLPEYLISAQWEYEMSSTIVYKSESGGDVIRSDTLSGTVRSTDGSLTKSAKSYRISSVIPERPGYDFDYWELEGYSSYTYQPGRSYDFDIFLDGGTITLIAHWTKKKGATPYIYQNGAWKLAVPYVYRTGHGWTEVSGRVYTGGRWKPT